MIYSNQFQEIDIGVKKNIIKLMAKTSINATKIREFKIEVLDWEKRKQAIQVMDKLRKKHKIGTGEKNSTEIIRHFRETRYKQ